jgi:hypothetical protein
VRPLLRSPLVDGEAYDTTSQLAQCVSPLLRYLAYDIATALKLVTTAPDLVVGQLAGPVGKGKQQPSTVERVTAGLVAATREGPLPTPTFGFVWPVRVAGRRNLPAEWRSGIIDNTLPDFITIICLVAGVHTIGAATCLEGDGWLFPGGFSLFSF